MTEGRYDFVVQPDAITEVGSGERAAGAAPDDAAANTRGEVVQYLRSPTFVLSLIVGTVLVVVGFTIPVIFDDTVGGLIDDVIDHTSTWPEILRVGPGALVLITEAVTAIVLNGWLIVTRRFRRLLLLNAAVALSFILAAALAVALSSLAAGLGFERDAAIVFSPLTANMAAAATVLRPSISTRAFRWLAAATVFVSTGVLWAAGATSPGLGIPGVPPEFAQAQMSGVLALIGVGIVSGSGIALIFKTPSHAASAQQVTAALTQRGLDVDHVAPARVDARGSRPWRVVLSDGSRMFAKVLGPEERAADLLYRLWRGLTLKRSGDREPFTSLRRAVEHEALLALAARNQGIRTPGLVLVGDLGTGSFLLLYEELAGQSLDAADPALVTDEVLVEIYGQALRLRSAGIAHRDLRLANVMLDETGHPWLIDFGFAELTTDHDVLSRDLAQLLAATAVEVGPDRTIAVAVAVFGPDAVAGALAWLQPLTLSAATRSAIGSDDDVHRLRDDLRRAAGIADIELPVLRRVTLSQILLSGSLAAAVIVVTVQVADLRSVWDAVAAIDLGVAALAVAASAASYLGAALAVMGSVGPRLRFLPTLGAQVAASFTNRLAPGGLGALATNARFLARRGLEAPEPVSAMTLNTIAGVGIHAVLLSGAIVAVARSANRVPGTVPAAVWILALTAVLLAVSMASLATQFGRQLIRAHVTAPIRAVRGAVVTLARRPTRVATLLAGSLVVTGGYTLAMVLSLRAAGGGAGLAVTALVYLAGSAIAAAAPTPGGLGVVEATLLAGYIAVGEPAEVALVAVVLFRLVTYWLPIAPGWAAARYLERTGQL